MPGTSTIGRLPAGPTLMPLPMAIVQRADGHTAYRIAFGRVHSSVLLPPSMQRVSASCVHFPRWRSGRRRRNESIAEAWYSQVHARPNPRGGKKELQYLAGFSKMRVSMSHVNTPTGQMQVTILCACQGRLPVTTFLLVKQKQILYPLITGLLLRSSPSWRYGNSEKFARRVVRRRSRRRERVLESPFSNAPWAIHAFRRGLDLRCFCRFFSAVSSLLALELHVCKEQL